MPIKRFLFCALLLLCPPRQIVASAHSQTGVLAAPPSPAAPFDIPSFTAELHRLSALLEKKPAPQTVAALRQSLPAQWTVSTSDSSYSISTDFLRDKLSSGQLDKAQAWLDHLAAQAESYSAARAAPPANAKTELDHILAEDDFAGVRPPTVWERFRQRVVAWLERMFLKLFGGMGRHPIVGQFLFWLVMLVGVSFIAFWLFRLVTRFDRMNALASSFLRVPGRNGFASRVKLPLATIFARPCTPPIGPALCGSKRPASSPGTAPKPPVNICASPRNRRSPASRQIRFTKNRSPP